MLHLFLVYGYQGAEEDSKKLQLTVKLLQDVLAEAQVVCVGQPLLVAGDLNADPAVIPCLAKGFSADRCVDLALAYSLGAGGKPDAACKFRLDECAGSRRDFIVGCSNALAASTACRVTDRWFTPHFSVFASVRIKNWTAEVSCPVATQPVWPACWIDTPDWSSSSLSRAVQDAWDIHREELGVVPPDAVLALRDAFGRSDVDGFWTIWSKTAEAGLFNAYCRAPLLLAVLPFWEEACYVFVAGVLEAQLWVAVVLADCIGLVMVMMWMRRVHLPLLTLLLLQFSSFVGVLSRLPDVLRGIMRHGFTGGAVCRHGPCGPLSSLDPWMGH